jgi:hypothetical protein
MKFGYIGCLFIFMSCSTITTSINDYQNKDMKVFLNDIEITGTVLSDTDKDILKRNIEFIIEKKRYEISDKLDADYSISVRMDFKQVGYSVFLMKEQYNQFIQISLSDKEGKLVKKAISNINTFFSPGNYDKMSGYFEMTFDKVDKELRKKILSVK